MAQFDIVIHGGRLIDGRGSRWFSGGSAIKDGKIASIGRINPESGQRPSSAKGDVVTPGYIDMHTHSDQPLIADGNAESKVRQGVTLDIIGESETVAPLEGALLEEYRLEHRRRNGIETDWSTFTGYFEKVMNGGISINVASGVSPQQVKRVVCGFDERPANAAEREKMNRLVAQAMEEGALGLTAAWHAKGPENPDEVVEMAKVAKRYGGYYGVHVGSEGIVAARLDAEALKKFEGMTIAEIAKLREQDPVSTVFDLIYEEGGFIHGVHHTMNEDDVKTVMRVPWVSIGSDGSALNLKYPGKPHPRSFGTNPRVLGKYTREEKVLQLEDSIRKMTSLPAQVLGLKDRGILKEGYWADVVVFDPDTVADTATYDNPKQYPKGIDYVLVNGTVVIDGGQHTGARPGRVIYGPGKVN